jgi:hypothetical protein
MYSTRTLVEIVTHKAWLIYSRVLFRLWRKFGLRPRFLSSKGQDRWVATSALLQGPGYFLELGAGNGFTGSDTFVLEQDYGWTGLCIEANPLLFQTMVNVVRRRCICVNVCIDETSRSAAFALSGDTSGIIADDTDNSWAVRSRQLQHLLATGHVATLETRTIADVLEAYGAPEVIDYVSLDVEGAEERIVRSFPFSRYRVLALTVERPTLVIHSILRSAGLLLVRQYLHDGFYLHSSIVHASQTEIMPAFSRKGF